MTGPEKLIVRDQILLEDSGCKPSWYGICASYLRGFRRFRDSPSDLLPADKKLSEACRRLYDEADSTERAVMDGTLTGREAARIFDQLVAKLAVKAGLANYVLCAYNDNTIRMEECKSEKCENAGNI